MSQPSTTPIQIDPIESSAGLLGRLRRLFAPPLGPRPAEPLPEGMEERISALLATRLRHLVLPADILAIYKARTRDSARRMMGSWCLSVGVLNIPCALLDVFILPGTDVPYVLGFRALITLMFLLSALFLKRDQLAGAEDVAIVLPCAITIICAGAAGLISPGDGLLEHYLVNAVVIIFTCLMVVQIDLASAYFLAGASVFIMLLCLAVSGPADAAEKLQTGAFYAFVMFTLARARQVQDLYRQRVFLLTAREELRNLAAAKRNEQLSSIAYVDPLTGIPNRRYFEEYCASLAEMAATPLPLSLCLMDIDWFKNLNDQLGHLQGDRCLRVVATAIRNNLRGASDILARFGGEEFVLLLPNTGREAALEVLERIRQAVLELKHPNPGTPASVVTISGGLVTAMARPLNFEALVGEADMALYRAKNAGRNKVAV